MGKNIYSKAKRKVKSHGENFKGIFLRLLFIALLGLVVYSNTFDASWHLDDYSSILGNHKIKNLSKSFQDIIPNPRGICDFTFAVNYYFSGPNVFGFHLINLIIHIISAFMVYFIIRLTLIIHKGEDSDSLAGQLENLPLAGALIFAAHPIQTQAVTYIVQRYASLATMFYLMSLIFFIKARLNLLRNNCKFLSIQHFPYYFCSFVCAILAMRTKEIAATIPFILLLYDFFFLKKSQKKLKDTLFYIIPFFILVLVIVALRVYFVSPGFTELGDSIDRGLKDPSASITRVEYATTSINVIITYIRLLFLPMNQNIFQIYPISTSLFSNYTYLSLFIHLAIIVFAVVIFKTSRLISFGIFWFYITLSVESSIFLIGNVIFEHRLYLPSLGFVFSIVGLALLKVKWGKISYIFFLIIITMFFIETFNRNLVWKDDFTLWNDCLSKSKNNHSPIAYLSLGNFYLDKKSYDASIAKYRRALEIDPYYAPAHNNLGYAYGLKGLLNMAAKEYIKALDIRPGYPAAHNNLGIVYQNQGKLTEAVREFKIALKLNPIYAKAYNNLGNLYCTQERLEEAIKHIQLALAIDPDLPEAHNNLGNAYYSQGMFKYAYMEYMRTLKLKPYLAETHNNLGNVYCSLGRFKDAIREYRIALKLKPDFAEFYYNLGNAYNYSDQLEEAIKSYKTALSLNFNLAEVHFKLGNIYFNHGNLEVAIKEYQTTLRIKQNWAEAHFNLGIVYKEQGLFGDAKEEFKNALKINPNYVQARQALESISK